MLVAPSSGLAHYRGTFVLLTKLCEGTMRRRQFSRKSIRFERCSREKHPNLQKCYTTPMSVSRKPRSFALAELGYVYGILPVLRTAVHKNGNGTWSADHLSCYIGASVCSEPASTTGPYVHGF